MQLLSKSSAWSELSARFPESPDPSINEDCTCFRPYRSHTSSSIQSVKEKLLFAMSGTPDACAHSSMVEQPSYTRLIQVRSLVGVPEFILWRLTFTKR